MDSDEEENEFLAPPTPDEAAYVNSKNKVPRLVTGLLFGFGLLSVGFCVAWIINSLRHDDGSIGLGTWHFILMMLFVIFTGVGANAFRIFTNFSRPVAKVGYFLLLKFFLYLSITLTAEVSL